jgi:predicted acylesterase/phospholipase RssA
MAESTQTTNLAAAGLASTKQAMVLSGGGARGAYEIGVMKALYGGASPVNGFRKMEIDIYTGTSVGAYNASFMASRSSFKGIQELEAVWKERIAATMKNCGNGVYRLRGVPLQLVDPGCYLHPLENAINLLRDTAFLGAELAAQTARFVTSSEPLDIRLLESIDFSAFFTNEPLQELIADTIDLAALGASENRLKVVASDWHRGRARVFDTFDMLRRFGTLPILASAALPGIFDPVKIDGVPYVDGGMTMNTPLKPAIEAGADVMHVIFADPQTVDIPFPKVPNTLSTFYRLYAILVANRFHVDLDTAKQINEAVVLLREKKIREVLESPRNPLGDDAALSRALRRSRQGKGFRLIETHKYRPKTSNATSEDLLNFSEDNIFALIDQGFADTVSHDCAAAGCILADPSVSSKTAGKNPRLSSAA